MAFVVEKGILDELMSGTVDRIEEENLFYTLASLQLSVLAMKLLNIGIVSSNNLKPELE